MNESSNARKTVLQSLEFTAEVLEIRELARVDGHQIWQVLLDRTAFVPQAKETGTLEAISRSGAVLQLKVTSTIYGENNEVWHTIEKPLQPGTAVRGRTNPA